MSSCSDSTLTFTYQNLNCGHVVTPVEDAAESGSLFFLVTEPPKFVPSKDRAALPSFKLDTRDTNVTKVHKTGDRTAILLLMDPSYSVITCNSSRVKAINLIKFNVKVYVIYLEPKMTPAKASLLMERILSRVQTRSIICMDANAHHQSLDPNIVLNTPHSRRGNALVKLLLLHNWVLLNKPNQMTHYHRIATLRPSVVDWILATPDIARLTQVTIGPCLGSDHTRITINVHTRCVDPTSLHTGQRVFIDCNSFIRRITAQGELDSSTYFHQIMDALSHSTKKCRTNVIPPFWNKHLAEAKTRIKSLNRSKPTTRLLQKDIWKENRLYSQLREKYRRIYHKKKISKMTLDQLRCHMLLLSRHRAMDAPIIFGSDGNRLSDNCKIGHAILAHFYPSAEPFVDYDAYKKQTLPPPLLTLHEIRLQVTKLKNNSPGEDRLNSYVMKRWNEKHPRQIRDLMNIWLMDNVYPHE